MARNSFVRATALTSVGGRVDYIKDPDKQEHLMAFVDNMPEGGWKELSRVSKAAAAYNPGRKICEGREQIIMLPNSFEKYDANALAEMIARNFTKKHGVPCAVAIHWNKKKNNYHAHVVFSERKLLERALPSVATRNTYFDVAGKRSTKKLCTDEQGNLLPGCRMVAKGENLSEGSIFGAKIDMHDRAWLREEKERYTRMFNYFIDKFHPGEERWQVYDSNKNYHLPTIRTKAGEPAGLTSWKERENERIREYNAAVDTLIETGELTYGQALNLKFKILRERKLERENRMAERARWKETRARELEILKLEREREREYYRNRRNQGVFALIVELGLTLAGYKVDDFKVSYSKPDIYGGTVKISRNVELQRKIDDMYIAMGKIPPSDRVLKTREQPKTGLDAIIARAETVKQAQQTSDQRDPFERDKES